MKVINTSEIHGMKVLLLTIVLFAFATAEPAVGQPLAARDFNLMGSTGFAAQIWKANEDYAVQVALPVTFIYPMSDRLRFQVVSAPSFNSIKTGGAAQLNGPSDTRLSGSYEIMEEKLLFTFGLNVPSGKSALTPEEFSVANILAIHALNFYTPILGLGLDVSGGLITAHRLAGFVVGAGVGYLRRGAYAPFADTPFEYNPGDEFSFSLGLDRPIGRNKGIMLDASYTIYGSDYADGARVFKAGNRWIVQSLAYYQGDVYGLILKVRDRFQNPNQIGAGDLVLERKNSNGNEFEASIRGTINLSRRTAAHILLENRIYSNNDYNVGGALVSGIGGGFNHWLASWLNVSLQARFYLGSLNLGTENASLTGVVVSGGFKVFL